MPKKCRYFVTENVTENVGILALHGRAMFAGCI